MRKKLTLIYLLVLALTIIVTAVSVFFTSTSITTTVLAVLAIISIITSLVPYFLSMYILKKHEAEPDNTSYKVFGIAVYLCCFPIKIWGIFAAIHEMLFGNNHWAFG